MVALVSSEATCGFIPVQGVRIDSAADPTFSDDDDRRPAGSRDLDVRDADDGTYCRKADPIDD